MSQINFESLFFDWGEKVPRPLEYIVRKGANLRHDLAFLSGMMHDATIIDCKLLDKDIHLWIDRDVWELFRNTTILTSCRSEVAIRSVNKIDTALFSPGMVIESLGCNSFFQGADTWVLEVQTDVRVVTILLDQISFEISLRDMAD